MNNKQINHSARRLRHILFAVYILFPVFLQAQERITSKGQIPILGWYSIPPGQETTVERYQEMKDAGFTISFSFLKSIKDVEEALSVADKAGMKIVITCPELLTETEKTVKKFMDYPALAGYFLRDEPNVKDFTALGTLAKRINAVDPKHFCYVNLFPNYADSTQLGTKDYRTYVNKFIKEVPLHFYSFDSYPLTDSPDVYSKWHQNLEIFADEARKSGKPFWGFAQSTLFDDKHEDISLATLRIQMYTNLAYGAQGLQYFTYWTPLANTSESFHGGPIGLDGRRSSVYDRVKQLNQEIKNLSGVFLGAKVISVQQTGKNVPSGTVRLSQAFFPLKVLETSGEGAVVSVLENEIDRFIVIVNRDYKKSMNLTLYGDENLKRVMKDGTLISAGIYSTTIEVEPGDVAIYKYSGI